MNKYIKTTLKILASLVLLILVGIGGLIIYAKYFYNQDVDITQYYADELPIKKERVRGNPSDYIGKLFLVSIETAEHGQPASCLSATGKPKRYSR